MKDKYLTKIEINLPIQIKPIKMLAKIKDFFLDTDGIRGCTYSVPSKPPVFKGEWYNQKTKKVVSDDIVYIYGCYDIENADIELEDIISYIKQIIETEGGEDLAWITYSNVSYLC